MATYAIGDVRGQFEALQILLEKIGFRRETDELWFTGNIIHSAPDSLAVLRFIRSLGKGAVCVLGREEMRLLAAAEGLGSAEDADRFAGILQATDRDELIKWLYQRPLLHQANNHTLVHAGIPAEWSLSQAKTFALEAECSLSMGNHKTFFENILEDTPTRWHAKHRGWKRVRFICNAFTRMRYCNALGRLDFSAGEAGTQPEGYVPWYELPERAMGNQNIVFGHWLPPLAAPMPGIYPLDSGCGKGGTLSALKIGSRPEIIR